MSKKRKNTYLFSLALGASCSLLCANKLALAIDPEDIKILGSEMNAKPSSLGLPPPLEAPSNGSGNTIPQDKSGALAGKKLDEAGKGTTTEKAIVDRKIDQANKNIQSEFEAAKNRHRKNINEMPDSGPARSKVMNDQKVLTTTEKILNDKKSLPEDIAKQAQDLEIRKHLLKLAKTQREREALEKEDNRLTSQIAELGKLAAAAANVASNLGEIKKPQTAGSTTTKGQLGSNDGSISAPQPKTASDDSSGVKAAEVTDAKLAAMSDQEKAKLLKELDSGKFKTGSKSKDLSLKNKLIAQLKSAEAAEKGAVGDSTSEVNQAAKRENAAAKVISDVLTPPADAGGDYNTVGGNKGSGGFSLSTSETSAEVKRLTDEADRQLTAADDTKAGILEVESPSLFERVKARINGCLRQRCVNSKSLAQN